MYKQGQLYTVKGHVFRIKRKDGCCIGYCTSCTKIPINVQREHLKHEALYKLKCAIYMVCLKIGTDLKLILVK